MVAESNCVMAVRLVTGKKEVFTPVKLVVDYITHNMVAKWSGLMDGQRVSIFFSSKLFFLTSCVS